jgi:hypothetical protein
LICLDELKNIHFLLLSAYSFKLNSPSDFTTSTPVKIDPIATISLRPEDNQVANLGILLTRAEFQEIIEKFQRKYFKLPTASISQLEMLTNRHAGILKGMNQFQSLINYQSYPLFTFIETIL